MRYRLAALIPYPAVLIGMHLMNSAWAAILLYHVAMLVFLFTDRSVRPPLLLRKSVSTPAGLAAQSAIAAGPVMIALWPWLHAENLTMGSWLTEYGLEGSALLLFAVYFALLHPTLEELYWRRLSHSALDRPGWYDVTFAGYHVLVLHDLLRPGWLPVVFVVLAGSSWFWRYSARQSGGIGAALLSHTLADAGIIIAAILLAGAA